MTTKLQIITKQKTEQLFWRGFGGRNRPPIGGLGDSPPNLGFCPTDENSYHLNTKRIDKRIKKLVCESQQLQNESQELVCESQQLQNESQELQNESQQLQNESQELQNESQELQNESQELQNESQELGLLNLRLIWQPTN